MKPDKWTLISIAALVVIVLLAAGIYFVSRPKDNLLAEGSPTATVGVTATLAQQGGLSQNIGKPKPVVDYFNGCPPSGDGGDPVLNTLKNRLDEATWQPTTVADLLALSWPIGIEQQPRSKWSTPDRKVIAEHEGTPVQVEGYLVTVKKMSPETCNCHSVDYVDFHIWLVDDPNKDRTQSIVVETTPRIMSYHTGWTLSRIREIARTKEKIRISGWLLMDPEHPDQIGKTRGSIWEIHPIMQIETQKNGQWMPLDKGTTGYNSETTSSSTLPTVIPESTATTPSIVIRGRQDNSKVQITHLFYDGKNGRNEPDEHVEITNTGDRPVDMTDWELQDTTGATEYKWENFTIQPGQVIAVYTNEVHSESGGFSFGSSSAIWANSGDIAELFDADKQLVSRFAYGNKK
ncbi:MAG: lamin tail domain-containing protein [Chloroflexota bacterium]